MGTPHTGREQAPRAATAAVPMTDLMARGSDQPLTPADSDGQLSRAITPRCVICRRLLSAPLSFRLFASFSLATFV